MTDARSNARLAKELASLRSEVAAVSRARQVARSDVPVVVDGEKVNVPVTDLLQQVPDVAAGLSAQRAALEAAEVDVEAARAAVETLTTETLPALRKELSTSAEEVGSLRGALDLLNDTTLPDMQAAIAAQADATSASVKHTVSDRNPVTSDGVGKPTWAVWEVRDENSVALRRFVWTGATSGWVKMTAGTDFIGAKAILAENIGVGAITAEKIDAGAVTAEKLDVGAVTAEKIDVDALTGKTITGGTITGSEITGSTITGTTTVTSGSTIDVRSSPGNLGAIRLFDEQGIRRIDMQGLGIGLYPKNNSGSDDQGARLSAVEDNLTGVTSLQINVQDEQGSGTSPRNRGITVGNSAAGDPVDLYAYEARFGSVVVGNTLEVNGFDVLDSSDVATLHQTTQGTPGKIVTADAHATYHRGSFRNILNNPDFGNSWQAIPNGDWHAMPLPFVSNLHTRVNRLNGGAAAALSGGYLVAPFAGRYLVNVAIRWTGNTGGTARGVAIRVNPTGARQMEANQRQPGGGFGPYAMPVSTTAEVEANAGDIIQVVVTQNTGGALNCALETFTVSYLGPS